MTAREETEQPIGPHQFFAGQSGLAALMREKEWAATPLGPPDTWPQSLRTVVNILLTSRYAMWMGWGPDLTFLYNDAYRPTLGIKHPWALGSPAREVWAEIWQEVGPRIESVLTTNVATYDEALMLFLERSGFPEETYHTFSYSPLFDDSGRIGGMLCVVTEESERVIGERRMALLRQLGADLALTNSIGEVLDTFDRVLRRAGHDLPFTLAYLFDSDGRARLALASGIDSGHRAAPEWIVQDDPQAAWPAGEVFQHPNVRVIDLPPHEGTEPFPSGPWEQPPLQAALVPIKQQGQEHPAGFLVAGLNPYRRYDAEYAGFVDLVAGQLAAGLANARAYEEERRRAQALAEIDRAKTTFFSNVSHEFRTPLTLLLGPLEELLTQSAAALSQQDRALVDTAHRNALRLLKLVNSLLDFARLEAGRVQAVYVPTDLAAYTAELASSFRSTCERAGLQLSVHAEPLPEPVYVDRDAWEKVVLNLVSNAFKFTFAGGITVTVRQVEAPFGAELTVRDTGTGIPAAELPHLFERFHRVEGAKGRTHEGTGIGLALVAEIVRLHGGMVHVESQLGSGSAFTVRLPFGWQHLPAERISQSGPIAVSPLRADAYVEEAARWLPADLAPAAAERDLPVLAAASSHEATAPQGRVLLADDNADMRDYVARLLRPHFEVISCGNGQEALDHALQDPPDLVLSDVMMPLLDGFGLLQKLREHEATRGIPVILLSARAGEESRVEGLAAGADDYLVKPFTARELVARVEAHLSLSRLRKEMITSLRRSDERLRQLLREAPVAIIALRGMDLTVELANPLCEALVGRPVPPGQQFRDVVPELKEEVYETLRNVMRTGELFAAHHYLAPIDRNRDGSTEDYWFDVVCQPLREVDGTISGAVIATTDVTTQVRARQELERANRELEEFAYVASHDLQEPLRMVNIYSQLMVRSLKLAPEEQASVYARYISDGVTRMEQLIHDLLGYSRTIHVDPEDAEKIADLNQSFEAARSALQSRIEETGARLAVDPLPGARGDTSQMSLVFQNLLSNALKYRRPDVTPEIRVKVKRQGREWLISVEDNGIGFEPFYAEKIFGLFKRLHRNAYPGTGLGLAITKRIVDRAGGRIWAEGRPGEGAAFHMALTAVDS